MKFQESEHTNKKEVLSSVKIFCTCQCVENETSNFNTYCNELSEYSSKVNSIKNVLPIYGNAGTQIKISLKNSNINIKQLRKSSFNLSNGLNVIGKCYTEVESKSCRLNLNDVLKPAREYHYGVGLFNIT